MAWTPSRRTLPILTALVASLFVLLAALKVAERAWVTALLYGVAGLCFAVAAVGQWRRSRSAQSRTELSPEAREEVRVLLARGMKVEAIQKYREATGAELAEAVDAIAALGDQPL